MGEDKDSFDQQWSDAFADAEMTPPEHVWTAIDGQLSHAAANSYKKQLVIYRWVAAACILLLMVFGWGYLLNNGFDASSTKSLADQKTNTESNMTNESVIDNSVVDDNNSTSSILGIVSHNSSEKVTNTDEVASKLDKNLQDNKGTAPLVAAVTDKIQRGHNATYILAKNQSSLGEIKTIADSEALDNDTIKLPHGEFIKSGVLLASNDQQANTRQTMKEENIGGLFSNTSEQAVSNQEQSSSRSKQMADTNTQKVDFFDTYMHSKIIYDTAMMSYSQPPKFIYGVPVIPSGDALRQLNQLWAGIVMSTGTFNPSIGITNSESDFATLDQSVTEEALVPSAPRAPVAYSEQQQIQDINEETDINYNLASSVSGGLAVGTRLGKRFIISSGVALNSITTSQTSTSLVNQDGDLYALTGDVSDEDLLTAVSNTDVEFVGSTVSLSNEYKYLSVPIKVGYILLDRQFNITLNTGVSSNFLLNSLLVSNSLQSINNNLDTRDSYQDVYFNFLTSVEFGYVIAQKYQISIEPNYNRALSNFTETDNLDRSKPYNLGVALGIKYIF